jgi:type VI secretion system VasD/TssJ family lipoprotein
MDIKVYRNPLTKIFMMYGLLVIILCGCSSRELQIMVVAGNDVNYGGNPVIVRLYQLKSDVNFRRATIETFWGDDVRTLGGDMVGGPMEVLIRPGETKTLQKIDVHKDAVYLAAAADFYRPDPNRWRHCMNISEYRGKEIYVLVGNDKLAVSPPR